MRSIGFTKHAEKIVGTMRSIGFTKHAFSATVAVVLLSSSCFIIPSVKAADPDPLVDVSPMANNTFVFRDVYTNGATTISEGGTRAALNVSIFPALTSEGITFVHFKLAPCGTNLAHTHPRATELLTMISGGPLQVGLIDTSGIPHIYILYPGDIVVFPRGLMHFELNVGGEEAFFISALDSQNPGVLTAGGAFLMLPTRAAAGALNQGFDVIEKLKREALPYNSELFHLQKSAGCVPNKDITTYY